MSEKRFKAGDRVRLNHDIDPVPGGALGTVTDHSPTNYDYQVNFPEYLKTFVMDSELEPAEPTTIRVGDRVRVTFESEVVAVGPTVVAIQDRMHGRKSFLRSEVTEVIKPALPTEFGSVIEVENRPYVFDGQRWVARGGYYAHDMQDRDYKVIRVGV